MKLRTLQALLALFIAVSAVALSAHATAHVGDGVEQCLLCASHADARPAAFGQPDWPVATRLATPCAGHQSPAEAPVPERLAPPPRAPPAIS